MLRALILLGLVLFSVWRLWTYPVDDLQSLFGTVGVFAVAIILGIGVLSAAGSARLWWVRKSINRLK